MKYKVAIYSGSSPSTVFIENLIKSLSNSSAQVYIFGNESEKSPKKYSHVNYFLTPKTYFKKKYNFIKIIFFALFIKPKYFYKLLKFYFKNRGEINQSLISWLNKVVPVINNLPDIFHIQWAKSLKFWFFLNELFKTKIIVSLRGAHINYSPIFDKKLANDYKVFFPRVDYFHAVSNSTLKEACNYFDIKDKTKVIYTAFDMDSFSFKKKDRKFNNSYKFVSVGRFHWKKGYQYSISAVNRLLEEGNNIHYTIITKGNPSEEILYQIDDLGISNNIHLKSFYEQDDIYQEIVNSDCLLLPSVEEGIANVVIESMGLGTPVISSDCGGMTEVIRNEENGFLYRSRELEELIDRMRIVINLSEKDRVLIINKAKSDIRNKFSMNNLGTKIEQLYLNVLKNELN